MNSFLFTAILLSVTGQNVAMADTVCAQIYNGQNFKGAMVVPNFGGSSSTAGAGCFYSDSYYTLQGKYEPKGEAWQEPFSGIYTCNGNQASRCALVYVPNPQGK